VQEGDHTAGGAALPAQPRVRPVAALYLVERVFVQLRAPSMLEALACALLAGPAALSTTPHSAIRQGAQVSAGRMSDFASVAEDEASELWVPSGDDSARLGSRSSGAAADMANGSAGVGAVAARVSPSRPGSADGTGPAAPGRLSIRTHLPHSGGSDSGDLGSSAHLGPTLRKLASFGSISSRSLAGPGAEWGLRIARCRDSFLQCLRSADVTCCSAAVRALVAVIGAKLPVDVARAVGLSDLDGGQPVGGGVGVGISEDLTSVGERSGPLGYSGMLGNSGILGGVSSALGGRTGDLGFTGDLSVSGRGLSPRPSMASSVFSLNSDILVDDLVRMVVSNRLRPAPDDSMRVMSDKLCEEITSALLVPLSRTDLPADTVAIICWAVTQLAGGAGARLPAHTAAALRAAAAAQREVLRTQTSGPWADGLLALAHVEWARLRPAATTGTLRCTAHSLLQFLTPAGATAPPPKRELEPSAAAAVQALAAASRSVAFAQGLMLSSSGGIPSSPPLPPFDFKASAVTEGAIVSLTSLECHACKVSFKRGEERSALLTVLAPGQAGCASPHAALLAPASKTVSAGHVLSAAPLLALSGTAHPQHRRWLICQVRPTVSMLQESLKTATRQGLPFGLSAKAHQLGDGVWVLSFETPAAVQSAVAMLHEGTAAARDAVAAVLAPLIVAPSGGAL
jgi:hypothetical protein